MRYYPRAKTKLTLKTLPLKTTYLAPKKELIRQFLKFNGQFANDIQYDIDNLIIQGFKEPELEIPNGIRKYVYKKESKLNKLDELLISSGTDVGIQSKILKLKEEIKVFLLELDEKLGILVN